MSRRHEISDADGDRIKDLLPGRPGQHGGIAQDNRRFLNAVLYVARTGIPWRDLPERYGSRNSPWRRFDRWGQGRPVRGPRRGPPRPGPGRAGPRLHRRPRRRREKKWDGTGGQDDQALGRRRGGFGTKIHGGFDGPGHPAELLVTGANESDIGRAEALRADHEPEAVIADEGYDKRALVEVIESRGAEAVIPTQANRKEQRVIDPHLYRERDVCERFWAREKQFRGVATRYEKKAGNFLAFVWLAALTVILK